MENLLWIPVIFLVAIGYLLFRKRPDDDAEEKLIKKRLEDPFIYDPETGAKITLGQAESGSWLLPDEEQREKYEDEQAKFYNHAELAEREVVVRLRKTGYVYRKFSEQEIDELESTLLLGQYDSWSYDHSYYSGTTNTHICFVTVSRLRDHRRTMHDTQLLFRKKISNHGGHYYFWEKTAADKFIGLFSRHTGIDFPVYGTQIITKSGNTLYIKKLVEKFTAEKDLEIEIKGENLFIKTLKPVNIFDLDRIEKIIIAI